MIQSTPLRVPKNELEVYVCTWLRQNDRAGLEQAFLLIMNEPKNCLNGFDGDELISIFRSLQPRTAPMTEDELDGLADMFSTMMF